MEPFVLAEEDCIELHPFAGVIMRAMHAERMTLSVVIMEPGSEIAEHSHPHEQVGYMVQGEAEFVIGGQSFLVRAGQMWRIPGGVPHRVVAGNHRVVAVDAFCPPRADMTRANSWGKIEDPPPGKMSPT